MHWAPSMSPTATTDPLRRPEWLNQTATPRTTTPRHSDFSPLVFQEDEMLIMDYNRVVKDLGDYDEKSFFNKVSEIFTVQTWSLGELAQKHHFEMYLETRGTHLPQRRHLESEDPVERLDVSILQTQLLHPLLGIEDPRRDKRIDFVGGIRGAEELEKRVANGFAVAFKLCATSIEELLAIADAGEVMPPRVPGLSPNYGTASRSISFKSFNFQPKSSGLRV